MPKLMYDDKNYSGNTESGLSEKMDKINPTGTGALSINRRSNTTIGTYSVAIGSNNESTGNSSYAEGKSNESSGYASHAEGTGNSALGYGSHAEGASNMAIESQTHAEGYGNVASGFFSHVEGNDSVASGESSHAQNKGTIAASESQTAMGTYNVEDSLDNYAVIVGNGTADNARSNAFTIDWNGNVVAAGNITGANIGKFVGPVSAIVGATSITFSDANILATSILDLYSENASGTPIQYSSATVTTGSVTFAIPALTEATTFKLWIRNI